MTTAYDISDLVSKMKAKGLDVVEDSAKYAVEAILAWFEESAKLSATPFDDVALVVVPQLKKVALEQIDKIDGVVG